MDVIKLKRAGTAGVPALDGDRDGCEVAESEKRTGQCGDGGVVGVRSGEIMRHISNFKSDVRRGVACTACQKTEIFQGEAITLGGGEGEINGIFRRGMSGRA